MNDDLIHEQPAEVGSERGVTVRPDNAFEHIAVLPGNGYRRLGAYLLLSGEGPGQHKVLLHGLTRERRVEQHGIAPEELVDEARGILLRNLYKGGNPPASRTEVTGATPLVHFISIDYRFVAVDFIYVIRIDGIRNPFEAAHFAA